MPSGKGTYGSKKGRPAVKSKNKSLAAMSGNKNKITRGDIITAAKRKKSRA
tara:strand:+ start:958 stop:1110 length:153 start_codon:yes stop_codon:yes gene_type:complete